MRIGEVAAVTGTTTKTLRFYEQQGLIDAPQRTAGGYRDYPPEVIDRLSFIQRGRAAGLTLAHISEVLAIRDHGQAPCGHVADLLAARLAQLDQQISELTALRDTVAQLHHHATDADPQRCRADQVCSYLSLGQATGRA